MAISPTPTITQLTGKKYQQRLCVMISQYTRMQMGEVQYFNLTWPADIYASMSMHYCDRKRTLQPAGDIAMDVGHLGLCRFVGFQIVYISMQSKWINMRMLCTRSSMSSSDNSTALIAQTVSRNKPCIFFS